MIEESVTFRSGEFLLSGKLTKPSKSDEKIRRPIFIVLHGFGSNKDAHNVTRPCAMLNQLGYATLRFDMRGCGESEGAKGHLICLEQVEDTRSAVTFVSEQAHVDPERIAVMGSSFGAAVAIYSAGVDKRIAAVVSASGWGHGERKFRWQHSSPEAWKNFESMMEKGAAYRERTGQSMMISRYEIVPIPPHLRVNVVEGSIHEFSAETAISMFNFRAEDVIQHISPRPILLLHSTSDSVTPAEQSVALWQRASKPVDLHLFADTDHFMFSESNPRPQRVVTDWLERYFPVEQRKIQEAH